MTTKFQNGDLVRKTSGGSTFILTDVNPNPNYKTDDEYYATGSNHGGYNNVQVDSPDEIELVMDRKAAAARKTPTREEIADFISAAVHSGFPKGFEVSESEADGAHVVVTGETDEGLEFTFQVSVVNVIEGTW